MKQFQINRAYGALLRLSQYKMPVRDSRNVYMLMRKLEPSYSFELAKEKALAAQYHATFDKTGNLKFQDQADAKKFSDEIAELTSLEVDIDFEPIQINCDSLGEQSISPAEIANLEGFVEFV